MPTREQDQQFFRKLMADVKEAQSIGYYPGDFIKMLYALGAFGAVERLLDAPTLSDGFFALQKKNRLDLTAEYLALLPEWAGFFSERQLKTAQQRLVTFGVNLPLPSPSTPTAVPPSVTLPKENDSLPTGDERLKALAEVTLRPHQSEFREVLRRRYGDGCQISGCGVMAVVQACHLVSVKDKGKDQAENGLLLRVDLHVLFDANVIGIDPQTLAVHVAPSLSETDYAKLAGVQLRVGKDAPNRAALASRWSLFVEKAGG